jgi:hypothetical protein
MGVAACSAAGGRVATVYELQSAMVAQFLGGTTFSNVTFLADHDYYLTDHSTGGSSNIALAWYGTYAETLNGGGGWTVCVVTAP